MRGSTSSPRSTSSTWRASPTRWSGSSTCRSASGSPTGCCARPTRSSWSTRHPNSSAAGWSTATSIRPSRSPRPCTHYFRTDNLTALRELALRFLADETEEQLLEHLRDQRKDVVWETHERILVGVTTAPGTDAIVRRASRMASRIKADLQVLHVVAARQSPPVPRRPADRPPPAVRRRRRRVERGQERRPGAGPHRLRPASTTSPRSWSVRATGAVGRSCMGGGSIVRKIARLSAPAAIDVHIIARRGDAPSTSAIPPPRPTNRYGPPAQSPARGLNRCRRRPW